MTDEAEVDDDDNTELVAVEATGLRTELTV